MLVSSLGYALSIKRGVRRWVYSAGYKQDSTLLLHTHYRAFPEKTLQSSMYGQSTGSLGKSKRESDVSRFYAVLVGVVCRLPINCAWSTSLELTGKAVMRILSIDL